MSNIALPTILIYEPGWMLPEEGLTSCGITCDRDLLKDAQAVVFHVPSAPDLEGIPKYEGQVWVAWSMESDVNYPQLRNLEYMKRFDLTMTYRFDSDIPTAYFGPHTVYEIVRPPQPKTEAAPAVYVASNFWDRSGRAAYIGELMRYLPVDAYGKCFNNRQWAEDLGQATKLEAYSRYKFTLAFENSRSTDYVTEKFFEPLIAGSVPVYLGAPNIGDFAPGERCFVEVEKFGGPRELADYLLRVAANEEEYQSYFAWKQQPLAKKFLEMVNQVATPPFGRLCAMLRCGAHRSTAGQDPIHRVSRWLQQHRQDS